MKSEIKAKICEQYRNARRAINRPAIKKKIVSEIGIYSDKNNNKPFYKISLNGEWCCKLSFAIKAIVAAFVAFWIARHLS